MAKRADLPGVPSNIDPVIRGWLVRAAEAIRNLSGNGDPSLRAVLPGEVSGLAGGIGGGITAPGGGTGGDSTPDLTPPPTPTWHGLPGFDAAAALTTIVIQWDVPSYAQGHGHAQTNTYGAKWPPNTAAPTFSNAVLLDSAYGPAQVIASLATELGTRWALWMKWQSVDGVESSVPAGGTNGIVAQSGLIDGHDLAPLIIEAGHLADGSVTGTKLAAEAVNLTKFANGIAPIGVVDALPAASGYTGPKVALLTTDGKLYRFKDGAWTRATDGADIVADSVTAAQIAAGAIGVTELAAGAVTAGSLAITDLQNLCANGSGESTAGWSSNGIVLAGAAPFWPAYGVQSATALTFRARDAFFGPYFDATVDDNFAVSAEAITTGGGAATYDTRIGLEVLNAAGTVISYFAIATLPAGTSGHVAIDTTAPLLALPTAAKARIWVQVNAAQGTDFTATGAAWHYTHIKFYRRNAGKLIVDGSIAANHLGANSIAVGTLAVQAGAIVNAMLGTAVVDDLKVANVAAVKLTAGTGEIGGNLRSTNYNGAGAGWIVTPAGYLEANNALLRGTVYAGAGSIGGILLNGSNLYSSNWNGVDTGFAINAGGSASFYNIVARGTIYATAGTFAGALVAATGTFSGSLSAATGTFSGSLTAGVVNTQAISAGAVAKIYSSQLTGAGSEQTTLTFTVPPEAIGPGGTCDVTILSKSTTSPGSGGSQFLYLDYGYAAGDGAIARDIEFDAGVVIITRKLALAPGTYTAYAGSTSSIAANATIIVTLLQR